MSAQTPSELGAAEKTETPVESSPIVGSAASETPGSQKRMGFFSKMRAMEADHTKKKRNFKEWFLLFSQDTKTYAENCRRYKGGDETGFQESIGIKEIFGNHFDATIAMMWAARMYEKAKTDPVWQEQRICPTYDKKAAAVASNESVEDEEVKYRILNIFKDEPLDSLRYNEGKVVSGKPLDLVDALIFPLGQDMEYTEIFVAAFRFFMPANKLLESLVEWYFVDVEEDCPMEEEQFLRKNRRQIQSRVAKVILYWIQRFWQDFEDPQLFTDLMKFVENVSDVSFGDAQKMTQAIREQRLAWYTLLYIPNFSTTKLGPTTDQRPYGLFWEPSELAVQLTLLDFYLFTQVKPDSYIHLLKGPLQKKSGNYNVALKTILEYQSWFRLVSSYVASIIYREDSPKKKTLAIKRWIKMARECRTMNSFNVLFAIIHGLKRPVIASNQAIWEGVPAKYLEVFMELENITYPIDDYAKYWEEWRATKPPGIPFFGAHMQAFIELNEEQTFLMTAEGGGSNGKEINNLSDLKDMRYRKTVNFEKFSRMNSMVNEVEKYRKTPYPETLMTTFESPALFGLPLPAAPSPNTPNASATTSFIDYTGYVMANIRDWAVVNLVDDRLLDKVFEPKTSPAAAAPPE